MQHLRATRPGADEVRGLFPVQFQFYEGPDINGFARLKRACVQFFERCDCSLNFRRLPGLPMG